ncbi:hypothetical protein ASPTUDRAFT_39993 [Aspergillus tubingensis CBS 134.48]|uniref:Uncharacterized protein n=1 Tax=Aspergillus tubingensis (strain CBS 134.48) TaxID=767770 RepID=A0A1L9NCG0_ASPTC|nr:hypothetical protein ASPTUDRAFT_39993 [Aspergillus tubingensis CBS 134.48]
MFTRRPLKQVALYRRRKSPNIYVHSQLGCLSLQLLCKTILASDAPFNNYCDYDQLSLKP